MKQITHFFGRWEADFKYRYEVTNQETMLTMATIRTICIFLRNSCKEFGMIEFLFLILRKFFWIGWLLNVINCVLCDILHTILNKGQFLILRFPIYFFQVFVKHTQVFVLLVRSLITSGSTRMVFNKNGITMIFVLIFL